MTKTPSRRPRGRPRVVVVGGGFAGMEVVKGLRDAPVEVLLVDQRPFATFQPLLYQVATGGLGPGDISYSLRSFTARFDNARFRQAEVTGLDVSARRVLTDTGEIAYDYLVVAVGAVQNYFGVEGAAEHASDIYSVSAAVALRDRIFENLELVAQGRADAHEPVVVVVGGGPTGVEIAGRFAEMHGVVPRAFPEIEPSRVRVVLAEMSASLLGAFQPQLQGYALDELRDRGVDVQLERSVVEIDERGVVFEDGSRQAAVATVWASGVTVPDHVAKWGLTMTENGRISVGPDLAVRGMDAVFAAGDVAADPDDPLPQLAQPATDGGRHIAKQISRLVAGRDTERFVYTSKGTMATIGRAAAVVEFPGGRTLTGLVGWLSWVTLHIWKLMSARNRIASIAAFASRFFSARGQTNVIVGHEPSKD